MHRSTRSHVWARASLVVFFGCGPVQTKDSLQAPIAIVRGDLGALEIEPSAGEYRAAFGWFALGGEEILECLDRAQGLDAVLCLARPIHLSESIDEVEVSPVFPSAFQIPLWTLPPKEALLDHEGATLAFGGAFIYDDRNRNQRLDPVEPEAAEETDHIVATTLERALPLGTFVVLREGPLHPLWQAIEQVLGCPEPPLGISVVTVDRSDAGLSCMVSADRSLIVKVPSADFEALMSCRGAFSEIPYHPQYPREPPPPDAEVECLASGDALMFWIDEGHYCDRTKATVYALTRCLGATGAWCAVSDADASADWNLLQDPPAWWPCARG
jgi:hypothetical protein